MRVIGDWLLFAQKAIHVGSALWFLAVVLILNPQLPEEWQAIKILLAINVGAAVVNMVLYVLIDAGLRWWRR